MPKTSQNLLDRMTNPFQIFGLVPLILFAGLAWLLSVIWFDQLALLVPIALSGSALGLWFLVQAALGRTWALALMTAFALIVPNISFIERDLSESTNLDAQKGLKLVLWLAMGLVAAARWPHYKHLLGDRLVSAFLLFSLLASLSTLWSPTPAYTAAGGLSLVASLLFCCAIAAELPDEVFFKTIIGSMILYLALNLMAGLFLPAVSWALSLGDEDTYRLAGVASHPNVLAKEIASFICLAVPLAVMRDNRRLAIGLGALGFAIIVMTGSRTSLIAIVAAFAIPALFQTRQVLGPLVWGGTILVGTILVLMSTGLLSLPANLLGSMSRGGDGSEILTMTGRTELWGFVWDKILQAPFLGHGFNTAQTVLSSDWWGQPDAAVGAHNMWLQSLLTLGIVGTIPFAYWHFTIAKQGIKKGIKNSHDLSRHIGIYIFFLGLAEVGIAAHPSILTYAAFLAIARDARAKHPSINPTPSTREH